MGSELRRINAELKRAHSRRFSTLARRQALDRPFAPTRTRAFLRIRRLVCLLIVLTLAPASGAAAATVPSGWLGVGLEPETLTRFGSLDAEFRRMRTAGADTVRFALYWRTVEPAAGVFQTGALDRLVRAAARHGLALLPVVLASPTWATDNPFIPMPVPRDPGDFGAFVQRLAERYGAGGRYWNTHPRIPPRPVRRWQFWNEVSNPYYWPSSTWSTEYPGLLSAAHSAIKEADPGATVIMSGLNTGGASGPKPYPSWLALDELYRRLDAQDLGRPFDEAAVHIYTRRVRDVLRVVSETREIMAAHGDSDRSLAVTELSWPAARGRLRDARGRPREFFAATTERGMARRLSRGLRLLAARRHADRIASVTWFQWASKYRGARDPFRYAGLRRVRGNRLVDTPALRAFRRVAGALR